MSQSPSHTSNQPNRRASADVSPQDAHQPHNSSSTSDHYQPPVDEEDDSSSAEEEQIGEVNVKSIYNNHQEYRREAATREDRTEWGSREVHQSSTPPTSSNKIRNLFLKGASLRHRAKNLSSSIRRHVSSPTNDRESMASRSNTAIRSSPTTPGTLRMNAEADYQHRLESSLIARGGETDAARASFRMPKQSAFQEEGARELVMSRFNEGPESTSLVSNLGKLGNNTVPVVAAVIEDDKHSYGQWISTANPTFDSLDCDDAENVVLSEERARRKGNMEPARWKVLIVLFLIGFVTGVVGLGINTAIMHLTSIKFEATQRYLVTPSQKLTRPGSHNTSSVNAAGMGDPNNTATHDLSHTSVPFWMPTLIYTAINLGYVTIAAALVILGEPLAKGSGIGEIKCYLNGIRLYRVVRLKTLVCKAIGILFSVSAGLPCGKEGPMIHSGACIGQGISTAKSSKFHLDTGLWDEFRSDRRKRNFVTAGAAAGVGVAFGAPIGGVLFAVEEVGSFWSLELTVMVFIAATVGPWTMQFLADPTSLSSKVEGLISFGRIPGEYHYIDLLFVALLGLMGGIMGAFFIKTNIVLQRLRKRFVQTRVRKFIEVWVITALVSVTLMLIITQGFQCLTITPHLEQEVTSNLKSFGCYDGEYNDAATLYFRSLEETIRMLTHTNTDVPVSTLFLHFGPYFALTILVYGINVPSGLFLPGLALGATFGRLYAIAWNHILGTDTLNLGYYSLFGAAAMLGGIVRMTISVIVIIMEATGNTTFFYPLAVVMVAAKFSGDLFSHGVYDEVLHLNHIPLLESNMDRGDMSLLAAGDIMNPSIICVSEKLTVGELCYVLKTYPTHNMLVVINNEKDCQLRGTLTRRTALMLLDKRAWERDLIHSDFSKGTRERVFLKLKKYKFFEAISKSDRKNILTLTRYMDQWPHTFTLSTPVTRVYRTFRDLGLRHIVIIDDDRTPVGVIARKQLTALQMIDIESLSSEEYNAHFGVNSIKSREYHRLLYQHQATNSNAHPLADDSVRSHKVVYGNMGPANEDHFVTINLPVDGGAVIINPDIVSDEDDATAVPSDGSIFTTAMETRLLGSDDGGAVASRGWFDIPDDDWRDAYRPKIN